LVALAKELTKLGARVKIVYLPDVEDLEKTGLDDFLEHVGMEELIELLNEAETFALAEELWRFNEEVVYIKNPGFCIRRDNGVFLSPSDLVSHAFSNRTMMVQAGDKLVEQSVPKLWLRWPQRSELQRVTYEPSQPEITEEGEYNLYKGRGCEPKKGSIAPWDKLMEAIFGEDKEARNWFERWCAIQFQQPGIKLRSAVVVWGPQQGTGKSFVGYTLRQLFGVDNFAELTEDDLHEKHNEWANGIQFAMGDEITGSDKRRDANKLKAMITREHVWVNSKGVKQFRLRDCINYYFTSNSFNAIYLEREDRRYFIQEVQNALPEEFFIKIYHKWLYEQDGDRHLLHYFLNLPLKGFNEKTRPPVTESKSEMLELGMSSLELFAHRIVHYPEEALCIGGTYIDSDLWTCKQLIGIFNYDNNSNIKPEALAGKLKTYKYEVYKIPRPISIAGKSYRLYAIRNASKWKKLANYEDNAPFKDHYLKHFPELKEQKKKY
jgi:hypothetical protein